MHKSEILRPPLNDHFPQISQILSPSSLLLLLLVRSILLLLLLLVVVVEPLVVLVIEVLNIYFEFIALTLFLCYG